MHTPDSLLAAGSAIFVLLAGGYLLYWDWAVYRAIPSRLLKARVAWTATLIFFLVIFLGALGIAAGFHLDVIAIGFLVANGTGALSYAAGDRAMLVARRYDFPPQAPAAPERLVWAVSPVAWPWLVSIWFIVPFVNLVVTDPLLTTLSSVVLPFVGSFAFWPIMIVGLLSAKNWIGDARLRENVRWHAYLMLSIAVTLWVGYAALFVLQIPRDRANLVMSILFLLVIYISYKASKSLVVTHRLPQPQDSSAGASA